MNRIVLILCFMCGLIQSSAQEVITTIAMPPEPADSRRVYAELVGYNATFFGTNKSVRVDVDLGQSQSYFESYTLLDDNGKAIKFNSMVGAMNYMGERGWKFVQAYVVPDAENNQIYHWLMYKDITDPSQIYEGLKVKNTGSDPKKSKNK